MLRFNELRAEEYKHGEKAGFESGQQAGFEKGQTSAIVQIYQEMGHSKTDTSDYLMQKHHMTHDQASKIVEQYWQS